MDNTSSTRALDANERRQPGRFFVVGGVIPADRPGYLKRDADEQLYQIAAAGEYAHVFAPRQSGKSSLTARVAERLRARDRLVAVVDLSQIGAREGDIDAARWFYSFAFRLVRQLRLRVDLQAWWQDKANLTNRQRITELYWDLILENTTGPVTVFIDAPQSFDSLPFANDLLASINSAHTARAAEPEFSRLNFIILTIDEPQRRGTEGELSLFAASERVELPPFSESQLAPLQEAVNLPKATAARALSRVHFWTGGQPFLTMKLARSVSRKAKPDSDPEALVDDCVKQLFASAGVFNSEPHLSSLQNTLLYEATDAQRLLALFGRVRKGVSVRYDPESPLQRQLLNEGLLRRTADDELALANRVYALAFNSRWVNEHLRFDLRQTSVIIAGLALALILPLWYTQLLPSGWIDRINNPVALEDATEAHERMRAWPGHRANANRLLADLLEHRSEDSRRLDDVLEYDRLLRELPGTEARANRLIANFWDRKASDFELQARRDEALLSRLSALIHPTAERRRKVAALIGEDYTDLLTTRRLPAGTGKAALSRDATRLTIVAETAVSGWALASDPPLPFRTWYAEALQLQAIVSRMAVELAGNAGAFRLSLALSHDRLDDVFIRIAAPSGRSVTLTPTDSDRNENGVLIFDADASSQLAPLVDEPANGSWTISVADTAPAISGDLSHWQLDFGRGRAEEFVQNIQLALPDPLPNRDASVTLSPSGRYALAAPRSSQGVAQVWEIERQQAVASLPLAPEDRILGFVLDERVVLVARSAGIAAWALATGEPSWAPEIDGPIRQSALSLNGQFLVVATGGEVAGSEIYDLIEERPLGKVASNIEHEAVAIANGGDLIAVADADRTVRLWEPDSGAPVAEFAVDAPVRALSFDARGEYLAITTVAGQLTIWLIADTPAVPIRMPHDGDWSVVFDPGGEGALIGNPTHGYQLHDANLAAAPGPVIRPAVKNSPYDVQMRLDRAAGLTYTQSAGVAQVWRLTPAGSATPGNTRSPVRAAASSDLRWLAVERAPGELSIFAVDAGPEDLQAFYDRLTYLGHSAPIDLLRFSADGELIASAASDGSVRVWETATARPRNLFIRIPGDRLQALSFSPGGTELATASATGIGLWDSEQGQLLDKASIEARVTGMTYTEDGEFLLAGLEDGGVLRLSLFDELRQDRYPLSSSALTSIATVGDQIVVADANGKVFRINSWSDKLPVLVAELGEPCHDLAISADNKFVICRGATWLQRLPLSGSNGTLSRLLPAAAVYPGIVAVTSDANAVAVVVSDAIPMPVELRMDSGDVAPTAGEPGYLLRSWRNRLGMDISWTPDPPPAGVVGSKP